jgi:hypothetical protein
MVTYSTNWMGPIRMDWFRDRGLTAPVTKKVESDLLAKAFGLNIGDTYEVEEVVVNYSGGRLDIYGLDATEYWGGKHEYCLDIMRTEDWNEFSDWVDDRETKELWTLEQILEEFKQDTGFTIRWWEEEE